MTVLVGLLVAAAFVAGYWPQRERLVQAREAANELRRQLSESRSQLAAAEAKARLGRVFGQYLALQDAVASGNYGEAQALSSPFFDAVHEERTRGVDPSVRTALDAVLMRRDAVTAGIARGEGSVREVLAPIARELRRALGYPLPSLAPAAAVPREARP
jgi:hypothetical protein